MQIWELESLYRQEPVRVIDLRKVRCLCHFREIWVPYWEAIHPVWCSRKELPDAESHKGTS